MIVPSITPSLIEPYPRFPVSVEGIGITLATIELGQVLAVDAVDTVVYVSESPGQVLAVDAVDTVVYVSADALLLHDWKAYWAMTAATSANEPDWSGNGRTLVQHGGCAFVSTKWRTLDGADDYFSLPSDSDLQLGDNARTWWVTIRLTNKTNTQTVFAKHNGSTAAGSEYRLIYHQPSDRFVFEVYSGSTTYSVTCTGIGSPTTGSDWLIRCTHDPDANVITIAGSVGGTIGTVDSTSVSGGGNSTGIDFTIGADSLGAVRATALVTRCAIWGRILNAREGILLYNGGSGLLLYSSYSNSV